MAASCTKLLFYHCGINSLLLSALTFSNLFHIYATISTWAHGDKSKANVRVDGSGDYNERFFKRGDASTQMEFVKRQWRAFVFVFADEVFEIVELAIAASVTAASGSTSSAAGVSSDTAGDSVAAGVDSTVLVDPTAEDVPMLLIKLRA